MKRFLLLALAAVSAAAPLAARELKFYNGDTPLESGIRLESKDFTVTPIGNGMVEVAFEPNLYIWSDIFTNTITLTAKCVSGQMIQFCPGGECVAGESVKKENIKINADQKLFLQFEYIAELSENEDIPTVVTELSAVDTKHENVEASITVVMNSSSGVYDIFANDASFRAVSGGIEYNFAAPQEISVYTLLGNKVYSGTVSGSGKIDSSSWASGVYLYRAGKKSGKLYLRK